MKSRQSQVARWIELLVDIVFPIKPVQEEISFYDFIIRIRQQVIEAERWNKISGTPREIDISQTDFQFLFDISKELRIKEKLENNLCMEEFWTHGMTTYLAQALGTSRQNVDRYISLGKIKESRTMDKAIYELLGEKIW